MGFFGGGKMPDGGANNPDYVNQDVPVAVPVTVVVAEDPEAGYRQQQQQQQQPEMPPAIHKTNATMYGTTTAAGCNTNETTSRMEFTTRLPTILPQCPHCRAIHVPTLTRTFPSAVTWLAVLVMLIIFWPLFWLPLVLDQCRHTTHICTHCHNEVGEVPAFADCCVTQRGS